MFRSSFPDSSNTVSLRARIAVINRNPAHHADLSEALGQGYLLEFYQDEQRALADLRVSPPALVLLDDHAAERGVWKTIEVLRADPATRRIGIIVTAGGTISPGFLKSVGVDDVLTKPYRRSTLLRAVSAALNRKVEESWQDLPPLQSQALEKSVAVFNQVSDIIAQGKPIQFETVGDACAPLVDAVNRNDFHGILEGVRDHDNYSFVHSMRVATLLSLFGHAIGLPKEKQLILASGGLMHDVGKVTIPHEVLNKPGRLSEAEWQTMRGHVDASITYLEGCDSLPKGILIIAAQHHEKLDGTGYPLGLKGGELNTLARMAAIVDVFSALTDRRIYKPPMAAEKALAIMADDMPNHLDQALLDTFRQMLLDSSARLRDAPALCAE